MAWEKFGLVYRPPRVGWQHSHAYIPTPFLITDEIIRVYVAFLDDKKIGRIGYVDVKASDPRQIISVSKSPVLDIGEAGCFDDNGVTPMTVLQDGDRLLMYYTGWQLSSTVRYYLLTGIAESLDGGKTYRRISNVPILERSNEELIVRSAAHVHHDNLRWQMWYIGGSNTIIVNGKQVPTYRLCYGESLDGIEWPRAGKILMEPRAPEEYGFGRPWIIKKDGLYDMWYSIRTISKGYHLGYATSTDGLDWNRKDDEVNLSAQPGDWDSEMTAFSAVIDTSYGRYLFYNGNEYGREGFGIAKWTQ